jgi:hypothetical protein
MKFKVSVIQRDLDRAIKALERVEKTVRAEKEDLPYRCAVGYSQTLAANLTQQKFASSYPALNPRYEDWKKNIYQSSGGFWELAGDLLKNLQAFKIDDGWMGGIPAGVMDSGGKSWLDGRQNNRGKAKAIAMYGKLAEARRPLFEPTKNEFAQDQLPKEGKTSLDRIRKSWR